MYIKRQYSMPDVCCFFAHPSGKPWGTLLRGLVIEGHVSRSRCRFVTRRQKQSGPPKRAEYLQLGVVLLELVVIRDAYVVDLLVRVLQHGGTVPVVPERPGPVVGLILIVDVVNSDA